MNEARIKRNISNIALRNKELWDATRARDFDAVYRLTFETLNWIVNSDEWFKKNYPAYQEELSETVHNDLFLLGLRQAYNSFKHNMDVISVEEKNYDMKLKLGENEVPIERIVWLASMELEDTNNSKAAFNAYCDFIEGASVLETFSEANRILSRVYSKFCSKVVL